jgi:hypothetical protein
MLVDPGKKFLDWPHDPADWTDPRSVASKAEIAASGANQKDPEFVSVVEGLKKGGKVPQVFGDRGYNSIEFPHLNPNWKFGDPSTSRHKPSLLLFDESRAVPEFSAIGQRAAKTRGVLAAEPGSSMSADEMADQWTSGGALGHQEFLSKMVDPGFQTITEKRTGLRGQIENFIDQGAKVPKELWTQLKDSFRTLSNDKLQGELSDIDDMLVEGADPDFLTPTGHRFFRETRKMLINMMDERGVEPWSR